MASYDVLNDADGKRLYPASVAQNITVEETDKSVAQELQLIKSSTATLTTNVNGLSSSVSGLSTSVTNLQSSKADSSALSTEVSRAKAAEQSNANAIATEKSRAEGAESSLSSAITSAVSTEKNRAEGAESALNTQVTSLASQIGGISTQATETIEPAKVYNGLVYRDSFSIYGTTSSTTATAFYKVRSGEKVVIDIPLTYNATTMAALFTCSKEEITFPEISGISGLDAGEKTLLLHATNAHAEYTINSVDGFGYIAITYIIASGAPSVVGTYSSISPSNVLKLESQNLTTQQKENARTNIDAISKDEFNKKIVGVQAEETIQPLFSYAASGYINNSGTFQNSSNWTLTYYKVDAGTKLEITIPYSLSSAIWPVVYCKVDKTNKSYLTGNVEQIGNYVGQPSQLKVEIESTKDYPYIVVSSRTAEGSPTCKRTYINESGTLAEAANVSGNVNGGKISVLSGKSIRYFGQSMMSNQTISSGGWAKMIAELCGMPYSLFVYDRADGNNADVDVSYKAHINYAKDGTPLAMTRTTDCALARIKRHVLPNDDVDYAIVHLATTGIGAEKGTIEDGFTGPYNEQTHLGALQEAIRYLTIECKKKCGFIIPYLIPRTNEEYDGGHYHDESVKVLEKWGVPYIDFRSGFAADDTRVVINRGMASPGFNLRYCDAHIDAYTIAPDAYDASVTYVLDSKVSYNGKSYKCKVDSVKGVSPDDDTKWQLTSNRAHDGEHLNNDGCRIIMGKVLKFIESI